MNRRSFLKALTVGVLSAGCAAPAASPSPAPAPPTSIPAAKPTAPAAAKPAATAPTPKPATQAAPAKKSLKEVTLRLDWRLTGYHAPFLLAVDKGFFGEQGLSAKVAEGQGSGPVLQLIGSGNDTFGLVDAGVLPQGIQRGIEARMLACVLQRNLFGILSPADAPISKPQDLPGKSLAGATGGAGEIQWPAFAKRIGIDPKTVNFVTTDSAGKYAALLSRKVDGAFHQAPIDAITYEAQNFPVKQLLYADYGVERVGHGIVVLNKTINDQPDMVRAFVAASLKGWSYSKSNPDEAVTISMKYFDTNQSAKTLADQWKATFVFHHSARTKDKPEGWMDKADWEDTQALLVEGGSLDSPLPVERYFTNDFLPR